MTIRHDDVDHQTGEYQFPDSQLVARVRTALARQSGIPLQRLLAEQEQRLSEPQRRELTPRQSSRQGDGRAHTANGNTPSLPTTRRIRLSTE